MRGHQLSKIALQFTDYKVAYAPIGTKFSNSILFFTKGAAKCISSEQLNILKHRGNILLFDPVDEQLPDLCIPYADGIVAASKIAYKHYVKMYPKTHIMLINHHVDPRAQKAVLNQRPVTNLHIGYFGELKNTITSPAIESLVNFHHVDTGRQDNGWFDHLVKYNLHYAVRQNQDFDQFKPFTKGFTAAHCNSNILIQREGQDEAAEWLGEDYPYFLHGEVSEENIINNLQMIKNDHGSKSWKRGIEVMQYVKEQSSDQSIANQLSAALADY